jgi:hypothetical protein
MPKKSEKHSLIEAVELALAGLWEEAHQIVQDLDSSEAFWIHAVLHRIEGDNSNAAYWYRQAGKKVSSAEPKEELEHIKIILNS